MDLEVARDSAGALHEQPLHVVLAARSLFVSAAEAGKLAHVLIKQIPSQLTRKGVGGGCEWFALD